MIKLVQMIEALNMFDGHYTSIAMFADDVREILCFAGRLNDESFLVSTSPGTFHVDGLLVTTRSIGRYHIIDKSAKSEHVLAIRRKGIVELFRGAMAAPESFGIVPHPIFAVQKAEELKEGSVEQTFALLRKPGHAINCFVMHFVNGSWEAYTGGLTNWVKECLWF